MTKNILNHIIKSKKNGDKLLAILLDPDKLSLGQLPKSMVKISRHRVNLIFVGGSDVSNGITDVFVKKIKTLTKIPIILFPGDFSQLTDRADSVLFLSLLSGRNPEYLVNQQIKSVQFLKNSNLEIMPTGYILIEGGVETSVQKVSQTIPIPQENLDEIVNTSLAGQFLGKQIIYLEAGSGAKKSVDIKIINEVSKSIDIPLIVGGGIRSKLQLENAYKNGADIVVIGTAFEDDNNFLAEIS